MPKWLRPTGNFGIGLQSLFLASKDRKFRCHTRSRMSGERYQIDFTPAVGSSGYLNVRPLSNENEIKYGTCFELICENDVYPYARSLNQEFGDRAQAVYNEFDYFLGKRPDYPQASIGILDLCNYIVSQIDDFAGLFPIEIYANGELLFSSETDYDFISSFQDNRNIVLTPTPNAPK